jgi:hypothetical protein
MILRDECKKIGVSVQELSVECDTPMRTLQNWSKSHPKRLRAYLDAIRFRQSQTGDRHLQDDLL